MSLLVGLISVMILGGGLSCGYAFNRVDSLSLRAGAAYAGFGLLGMLGGFALIALLAAYG